MIELATFGLVMPLIKDRTIEAPQIDSLPEFTIYNLGDINDSFFMAAVFDITINLTTTKFTSLDLRRASAISAGLLSCALFTVIEWQDKKDIPAALLGAGLYTASRLSYLNQMERKNQV